MVQTVHMLTNYGFAVTRADMSHIMSSAAGKLGVKFKNGAPRQEP